MRATVHVCTQCAKSHTKRESLPGECQPFTRRVYADSFRMVGQVLEVDAVEYERGVR